MESEEAEAMSNAELREWFCGTSNSSYFMTSSYQSFRIRILNDTCLINLYYAIFHITFCIVFLSVQGFAYIQTKQQKRFLLKSSGHNFRWILSSFLLLMHTIGITEGILTDSTHSKEDKTSFVYLYVPSICAFVTAGWAILVSHYMEVWQKKWPSFVLTIYWTLSCGAEIGRLLNLMSLDLINFKVVRFDVGVFVLLICGALDAIEMNHIRVWVSAITFWLVKLEMFQSFDHKVYKNARSQSSEQASRKLLLHTIFW